MIKVTIQSVEITRLNKKVTRNPLKLLDRIKKLLDLGKIRIFKYFFQIAKIIAIRNDILAIQSKSFFVYSIGINNI